MRGVKGLSILGIVLLAIGITGFIITFEDEQLKIKEEKDIQNEDFNAIDIQTDNAKVEVIATKDTTPKVMLSGSTSKNNKINYTVDVADNTLLIKLRERQGKLINFDFHLTGLTLKVYVPQKQYASLHIANEDGKVRLEDLNIKEINAAISNGHLEMKDINGAKLIAGTEDGSIQADNVQMDDMKMTSSNGNISLTHVETATISTETEEGKIELDDVVGKMVGKTSNGSITLLTNDLERDITFETEDGNITIETATKPENVTFDVDVKDGKADILGESTGSTVIGNGDNSIKLSTSNGNITVK